MRALTGFHLKGEGRKKGRPLVCQFIFAASILGLVALGILGCRIEAPTASGELIAQSLEVAPTHGRYLVLFSAEQVPSDFGNRIASLGGSVEASLDGIGVAVATGLTEAAAAELAVSAGVQSVEHDPIVSMEDDSVETAEASTEQFPTDTLVAANETGLPQEAKYYKRQWNMRAVFADQAWAAGYLGSRDVVVAILDTGIDYEHPDLKGLVDTDRSKSFVPEENPTIENLYPGRLPISDLNWHGTAAASIVSSNAILLAGINRDVTLLAVKVADRFQNGSACRLIAGIVYAADQGADVISISRGHEYDKNKIEDRGMVAAFERAANYAFRKGSLIVSLPFNDAADLDHNGEKVRMPCEAAHVICVSATAPTGASGMEGPWVAVDARATRTLAVAGPYSGFGYSAIDVAAPGGAGAGIQTLHTKVWLPCTTTPSEGTPPTGPMSCNTSVPIDMRLGRGVGTSFSVPHVAGLAALLVAQLGHGNPALIRARILHSADDLGEPGTDPYYGKGRINVARALGLIN